ncbi:type II toxin-antitoxin system VapB family antitoxin [Micromonospora okii]|uniref:type II toxin-antitoxin system VapB family antitoxin n=1 Tax=Micromonospora okii TaxID=1182970 RepID=UPI001E51880E|nr:type II toxin-antitoxin system VapB family antitoxin [Micromonospora okii]
MKTVIDLDDELLERARRELGTKSKKDTIHAALRLAAERTERLDAIRELLTIDRDWGGLLEDDKTPEGRQDAA